MIKRNFKVKQTVLLFVLETTQEVITFRGLLLFGEFLHSLKLNQ